MVAGRFTLMRERPGHLLVTLRSGEALTHVPSYADALIGACRATSRLDGGSLERVLTGRGGGFRALGVYPSRRSLGRVGEQHIGFDDLEEQLGFSRTYRIRLGTPGRDNEVVQALRDLANVEAAVVQTLAFTPFATLVPQAPRRALPDTARAFKRVRGAEALALEPGDERVTIAVIDTGIALGHPEFRRKLLAGYDTVDLGLGAVTRDVRLVGDSRGHDFAPRDECGHGSHVAGVIAAQGWRIPPGIGGRSLILPIRVLAAARVGESSRVVGVGGLADINAGMKVAIDSGAKVINMSFGTPESGVDPAGPPPHADVIRYARAYDCVLVAAAGNSGVEERFYPAALPEVIAVGSVDDEGRRSRFTTYGDHLTLSAPGEQIVSAGRHGYRVSNGTSHAAPYVAGVAALMVSHARRKGRDLSGAEVKQLISESAVSKGGYSHETGYGMLDALAALRRVEWFIASESRAGGRL
jgi:subtilisin family serine protease